MRSDWLNPLPESAFAERNRDYAVAFRHFKIQSSFPRGLANLLRPENFIRLIASASASAYSP